MTTTFSFGPVPLNFSVHFEVLSRTSLLTTIPISVLRGTRFIVCSMIGGLSFDFTPSRGYHGRRLAFSVPQTAMDARLVRYSGGAPKCVRGPPVCVVNFPVTGCKQLGLVIVRLPDYSEKR